MAYYDDQGFSQMQREALERMRDMQRRSKSLVFEQPSPPPPTENESQPAASQNAQHEQKQKHNRNHRPVAKQNDIISSLFSGNSNIDSEKLLILLLLFVLYKNKADIKLLIALGYLLI